MATGENKTLSIERGFKEIFDLQCTPCSKDSNNVEAINYCVNCLENLCAKCTNKHNKIWTTASHKLLDKTQMNKSRITAPDDPHPADRCYDHHDKPINMYCATHDIVCCSNCVAASHRKCDGILSLAKAAKGVMKMKELHSIKINITKTIADMKRWRKSSQNYLETLDKDKTSNLEEVHDFTGRLIKRINDLEQITTDQITAQHKTMSDKVNADIKSSDEMISIMEQSLKKLDHSQKNTEAQVFVRLKMGKYNEVDGTRLLQQLSKSDKDMPIFKAKIDIERSLNDLTSLGSFVEATAYHAVMIGDYNVKVSNDVAKCNVSGSCQLQDGTVILADYNNQKLKHLDTSYTVSATCHLPFRPWGICCVEEDEVAVTLCSMNQVQFVSVGDSMSLCRSFNTPDGCKGICYRNGELFVACGGLEVKEYEEGPGHIVVFSLAGIPLRTIQTCPAGQQIFSLPVHIAASTDNTKIHVADKYGVITIDRNENSNVLTTFSSNRLDTACGICTLPNDNILVCGLYSHNVLQVSYDGRHQTVLLNEDDMINEPFSLCFDKFNVRLIVTIRNSNHIKVFDLAE